MDDINWERQEYEDWFHEGLIDEPALDDPDPVGGDLSFDEAQEARFFGGAPDDHQQRRMREMYDRSGALRHPTPED